MKAIEIWCLTWILTDLVCFSISHVDGKCGYPGKPYKAELDSDKTLEYSEGEKVTYKCKDHWWFPQILMCEKGRWKGKRPRCGDSVDGIVTKDVRVEDISSPDEPKLMFEHLNMTLIDSDWANAFASNRFSKARLRISDSKRYRWTFKFTSSFHKLFVQTSFNLINYIYLTAEQKQNFTFNVSVYLSPERECVLDNQIHEESKGNRRIRNYFACDSISFDAYKRDVENPGDYMIMETQSSVDLPHDLIVVSFGKSYGTSEEPLCGEPEISVSQVSKSIQQYKSYTINCKSEKTWLQVSKHNHIIPETSIHDLKCVADMKWNGSYPVCIPRNPCPFDKRLTGPNSDQIVISSLHGLYFLNDTEYYAYEETHVHYGCANNNVSLIGKESRTCLKDGSWSNTEPHCYDSNESAKFFSLTVIGILGGTLSIAIILAVVSLYVYIKRIKAKMNKQIVNQRPESGGVEVYDDINVLSDLRCKDDIYDTYDVIEEEQEVRYTDPCYAEEQDYIQMPVNVEEPVQFSHAYLRIPNPETDYLDMSPTFSQNRLYVNVKYKL